jgi:general secretion pathway protein D
MPADDEATTAVLFLAGKGNLTRDFNVQLRRRRRDGTWALRLDPKQKQRDYDWLVLGVDAKTLQIRSLTAADQQGGGRRSSSATTARTRAADSVFVFKIPRGADVITLARADRRAALASWRSLTLVAACATSSGGSWRREAELAQDFDRAVVEYTKIARANPANTDARTGAASARSCARRRTRRRAAAARRLERYEEAVAEYQLAAELNPTDAQVDTALREPPQAPTKLTVTPRRPNPAGEPDRADARSAGARPRAPAGRQAAGHSCSANGATSRAVFLTVGRFANISTIFDSAFRDQPLSIDLRNATLSDALAALTASTRTFYRITAPKTITIIPDTPASAASTRNWSSGRSSSATPTSRKRSTCSASSSTSGRSRRSRRPTRSRSATRPSAWPPRSRLITAIDKARPEVVIDVELLEVDRTKLREYGLQIASPGVARLFPGRSTSIATASRRRIC